MIFCSWNISGLNHPHKQEEVKSSLLKKKVDLLGSSETKIKQRRADKVKKFLGAEWTCFKDYSLEPNDRIWLCWRHQNVGVTILISNPQLVHCQVEDKDSQFSCHLTFFIGYDTNTERKDIWEQLVLMQHTW